MSIGTPPRDQKGGRQKSDTAAGLKSVSWPLWHEKLSHFDGSL